jgi:hypothetical protein
MSEPNNEQTIEQTKQTYGERLVRSDFNPSGEDAVNNIKEMTAIIIDKIKEREALEPRLAALAITTYENAAMWAVKLLTTKVA